MIKLCSIGTGHNREIKDTCIHWTDYDTTCIHCTHTNKHASGSLTTSACTLHIHMIPINIVTFICVWYVCVCLFIYCACMCMCVCACVCLCACISCVRMYVSMYVCMYVMFVCARTGVRLGIYHRSRPVEACIVPTVKSELVC